MCRLRNIAMRDYHESVTTGQTDGQPGSQADASQATQKTGFFSNTHLPAYMLYKRISQNTNLATILQKSITGINDSIVKLVNKFNPQGNLTSS